MGLASIAGRVLDAMPAPLHRALLPLAHRIRHRWRTWRGTPIEGAAAILTNLNGDLLLLRHSYGPQVWSLPGGGVEPGEDPALTIRRELEEELGLTLGAVERVARVTEEISGSHHTAHIFTAMIDAQPVPDGREVIEARFFPTHSLPEPLGRITASRIALWRKSAFG